MAEHCFIVKNNNSREDDATFWFPGDTTFLLGAHQDMADCLVQAGIFPSKGQAKKNGWVEDKARIPPGWSEHTVGKLRHRIFIICPTIHNLIDPETGTAYE